MSGDRKLAIVILISGRGSNMQSIIDNCDDNIDIRAVISNCPGVLGLERAQAAGITTETIDHTNFPDRRSFDQALQQCIDKYSPDLVVLAGFMRVLTPEFVNHYLGRMINIHPALLPAFPGLNTHSRALDAGVEEHGATVHYVTAEVDGGPAILHASVPVYKEDTEDILAARVLEQEHKIFPQVIQWIAEGQLEFHDGQAFFRGQVIKNDGLNYADLENMLSN
jgi:phosphoribosylglycinamide formyltransferase-1